MNNSRVAHEGFMNGSRIILPRVGGGVGGGLGVRELLHPTSLTTQPLDAECKQATDEDLDLSDLDLLDDEHRHANCGWCDQPIPPGSIFVALCGRRAIASLHPSNIPPPNACPDCLVARCPKCCD